MLIGNIRSTLEFGDFVHASEKPNSTMVVVYGFLCQPPRLLMGIQWSCTLFHLITAEVSASFGRRLTALPVHAGLLDLLVAGLEGKGTRCVLRGKTTYLSADNTDLFRFCESPTNTIMKANLNQLLNCKKNGGSPKGGSGQSSPICVDQNPRVFHKRMWNVLLSSCFKWSLSSTIKKKVSWGSLSFRTGTNKTYQDI